MKKELEIKGNKSRIHLSIEYGDAIVPVIRCDDGFDRVPLKPIVELVGAQWEGQRRKTSPTKYLGKRLGTKTTTLKYGGTPQTCIRLDRVTTFLNSLNPENIRGMGNSDAADWLEGKHCEWDDLLHEYESASGVIKSGSDDKTKPLSNLFRMRNQTDNNKEKLALTQLINKELKAIGVDINDLRDDQMELKV
ncbi:MAG: hypothetical protein COA86_02710 [Kangiella sp.]|nr:MAG: hypothetical protein COA86_02710 [Kangiella sp.]